MFAVAQFGAATSAIQAATVDGDAKQGVQFVGQCQGLIHDVPTVQALFDTILQESQAAHFDAISKFGMRNTDTRKVV